MANFHEIISSLNGIDWVVLVLLLLSTILGIKRGFAKEIIALITWIAAFVVASLFATDVASLFTSHSAQAHAANGADSASLLALGVSYLLLFIGTLLCGQFVEYLVNYAIEGRGISIVNRFFGAVFGFARGWFLILLVMFAVSLTAMSNQDLWKESKMVIAFGPGVKWLTEIAQPYLHVLQNKMKEAGEKANGDLSPEVLRAKTRTPSKTTTTKSSSTTTTTTTTTPAPAPTPAEKPAPVMSPAAPVVTAPTPPTPPASAK